MRALSFALAVALLAASTATAQQRSSTGASAGLEFTYSCSEVAGTIVAAPTWAPERDGTAGQQVVITFRGDKEIAEATWSFANQPPYYEAVGLGVSMRTGFSIVVFAEEYVETYVYNAGTTELLYTSIRSGSALLPNSMKAFKGRCKAGQPTAK